MPHVAARIPYETVAEIRRRFAAGDALKVIAIEEGVGVHTAAEFVADLPQQQPHLEAKRLKIVVCLDVGMGVRETAEKVGCPISSVVRILNARKRAEPPYVPTPEELEAARAEVNRKERERRARRLASKAITVPATDGLEERIIAIAHDDAARPTEPAP